MSGRWGDGAEGKVSRETFTLSAWFDANHNNENAFKNYAFNEKTFFNEKPFFKEKLCIIVSILLAPHGKFFFFLGATPSFQERIWSFFQQTCLSHLWQLENSEYHVPHQKSVSSSDLGSFASFQQKLK